MQITNCKLSKRVKKKLLEFFVLQVTARSAADILGIQPNSAILFYRKIRIGSPKVVRVRAPLVVGGPNSRTFNMPLLDPKDLFSLAFELIDEKTGRGVTNRPFVIIDETDSDKVIIGKTNKYGRTGMNKHLIRNSAKVRFLEQLEIAVLKED